MDIFRFVNPLDKTRFRQGKIVNGLKSKMWIERYREGGEFTLVANVDTGVMAELPIGCFISHVDTTEVMMVENHEINDQKGKQTEVVVTGRGFETYFEQRIVGSNKNYPTITAPSDYVLAANYTWIQAVQLISDHIIALNLIDDNNSLNYISIVHSVGGVGVSEERVVKIGDLYKSLNELLANDDLGIRIIRPGSWSPLGVSDPNLLIQIHKGVDRSASVIFSYDTGEIESADYLWSNKKFKNAALVTGKWVETVVIPPTAVGLDRRWMFVNASDLDSSLDVAPTGPALTFMIAMMQQWGLQALAAQNPVAITKAEVSKEKTNSKYRIDYDVGDTVTVAADYNETTSMRVTEYVEIDDENGTSGYPTLSMIE